ncbi:dual specificity protein phosphatase 13 isoform X3 [Sturnira hondurensis]|uniref:dual specificity protein phosphatase 13 isoform X3 n=1 Tax=Sturnira hondurensis TaxID=192404 RepID=UPI001879F4A8|nr:dual specificity protein phosphatase 13 isoform X3 [Sturnira hondurensis]
MGLPQPRLPSPALPTGPEAAGCRPELRGQTRSSLPATGVCCFATLALALLVLLEALPRVDTQKMVRAQCEVRPIACYSICFLQLPELSLSHCLRLPQKQHQVCRDKRLEVGSAKCLLQETTAWARYPHRYWLRGPRTISQDRHSFPAQHQTQVLVPLRSQLGRVQDSLSQQTLETPHPTSVRPDLQRWPESRGMDSLQKQDLRRPKIHRTGPVSPYQPPTLSSLQRLLWARRATTLSHVNEVWPNLFLGDAHAARDRSKLTQLGITHIVNVAAGKFQVDTGAKFYHGMPLEYYGIEAEDSPFFDLSVYFLPVARYIRTALSVPQGRVLVHCAMGVSRSATVVLAFLMIYENLTLVEAIQTVQAHRDICPNSGFLRQLQVLDNRLGRETERH